MRSATFRRSMSLLIAVLIALVGLGLSLGILEHLTGVDFGLMPSKVRAAPGEIFCVTPSGATDVICDQVYTNVQAAVDGASGGEEIRVATGIYTGVQSRSGISQVVYIDKGLTIRGGYSTSNWVVSAPAANPTTLDAQTKGRVLYATGNISLTIEALNLINGDATGLGGELAWTGDTGGVIYIISATTFLSNNHILNGSASSGGGVYLHNSLNSSLISNRISNNTGLNRAGGLFFYNSPTATLIFNTISDNVANHLGGGQKHHGGALFLESDYLTLRDNLIQSNRAADNCGGLCFSLSDFVVLSGNTIVSNTSGSIGFGSSATGGGLNFNACNNLTLASNLIRENTSIGVGGGMTLQSSRATMTNNVFIDNRLVASGNFTGSGSALFINRASAQMWHTTIARNHGGDGSGVFVTDSFSARGMAALTNTILASHTVGISVTANNTVTLNSVLWYTNTINYGGLGTMVTTNEYTGNPAFSSDGYHLTVDSAAIDLGLNTGIDSVHLDIDGDPRPMGNGYDLGADEFISKTYLPVIIKS